MAAQSTAASKRTLAKAQLTRADKLRAGLEGRPQKERTEKDYETVVTSYRHVVSIAPAAPEAPTALVAVAELYHEMGRAFYDSYFQKAIETYQTLLKEYPASHYRADAMFTIGHIQQEDLDRPDDAQRSFDEFLSRYPRSPKAPDAQQALKDIAAEREHSARAASKKAMAEEHARERRMPQVTAIREWNAENYTRVVISLEEEVKYQAARIANPDRIYFDLYTARLSSALAGKTLDVQNGFLKSVRVAQNQAGVVRVVLEVEKVRDYSVFLLKDPYRLVVDVYGDTATAKAAAPAAPPDKPDAQSAHSAKSGDVPAGKKSSSGAEQAGTSADSASTASKTTVAKSSSSSEHAASSGAQPAGTKTAPAAKKAAAPEAANTQVAKNQPPPDAENAEEGAPAEERPATGKSSGSAPAAGAGSVAQPTHRGDRSLTRTLGLKIGKIMIDPGHGGHDTGTIGPTGLQEKDLTLDVAQRLGKLIEQKLGAEVVYTRTDDTFVPLEERTAMANQAKADLFVSIHANSSSDSAARGVETYYLNLTDSAEAREVAARENALAQASIHDLQDLVQKIARNEKIDESRELATEVQAGLAKRLQRASRAQKNRGVKRAPFVVLLGANMPSILTEISFISNPADEAALKKGEQRQRVAEGILAGITHYLESLGSAPHTAALISTRSPIASR